METKLFEIRDRATFIPVIAIRLSIDYTAVRVEEELYLLRRSGYSREQLSNENDHPYVLLGKLQGGQLNYDPYDWGNRTMTTAHDHIIRNWYDLKSGDVIDVEFIRGETSVCKKSERLGETNIVRTFNPDVERIIE